MNQTTIKDSCLLNGGVGLHSGKKTDLFFFPAPANHGIVFNRADKNVEIPANYRYAKPSALCTTIENEGVEVSTIEHLLSVCNGLGIDNLLVELHDKEVPIMDGSGLEFHQVLQQAGIKQLDCPKKVIRILDTISYKRDDITIFVSPSEHSGFTFSIDFPHEQIGEQEYSFQLSEKKYAEEIVSAKTFGFRKDYSKHKKQGLIKGGNEKNAVILNEEGQFDNIEVMTWLNEPNLHKVLDQIGDFYLADNMRIVGNIFSHKSGHSSHLDFIRYMMEECSDKYAVVEES
ncbi:MAG: UDP-3-O-[3-hydroxymyristoyl] N-acetylglucosamine deacetylase [Proteobacteria bacterium]|nr:UDP-3-O-[3-hydroxymyristoyl] N-acetylglucosamine deacetylase [Pseudomonadota bacterium]